MSSEVKWIHLDIDMFSNSKIKYLRKLPAGNDIILVWVLLLTLAGKCNAGGMILLTQNVPYTTKMIADEFDFDENTVKLAIEAFVELGMVSDSGFLSITGWEEHQDTDGLDRLREYNRLAKQKSRERQKQKQLKAMNEVNDMSMTNQGQNIDPSLSISLSNSLSKENEGKSNRGVGKERKETSKKKNDIFEEFADGDQELLEALIDFEKMRVQKKKPMGDRAKKILVNKLNREFKPDEWIGTLEQSILNGWDSVWPLKDDRGERNGTRENRRNGYGGFGGKDQDAKSKWSDFRPSLDYEDKSTWRT